MKQFRLVVVVGMRQKKMQRIGHQLPVYNIYLRRRKNQTNSKGQNIKNSAEEWSLCGEDLAGFGGNSDVSTNGHWDEAK